MGIRGQEHILGDLGLLDKPPLVRDTSRLLPLERFQGGSAVAYSYDDADQLTAADYSGGVLADEAYAYDANGNRAGSGYVVGANNRLFSDGTFNYQYDNEGNRTRKTNIATGESVEYQWDLRNRLTRVVHRDGQGAVTETADYQYDVFDRRTGKAVDEDGDGDVDRSEQYVYDGNHLLLQFDGTGNLEHRYLHGPLVDQVLADERVLSAGNEVDWLLADAQGTIRDVARYDAVLGTTSIVDHLLYDSFGQLADQSDPLAEPMFQYTGREWDAEAGLYYYRARWYDAETGRFVGEDPLSFAAGDTNLSRYVGNNPTNFTDPSGMLAWWPDDSPPISERDRGYAYYTDAIPYPIAEVYNWDTDRWDIYYLHANDLWYVSGGTDGVTWDQLGVGPRPAVPVRSRTAQPASLPGQRIPHFSMWAGHNVDPSPSGLGYDPQGINYMNNTITASLNAKRDRTLDKMRKTLESCTADADPAIARQAMRELDRLIAIGVRNKSYIAQRVPDCVLWQQEVVAAFRKENTTYFEVSGQSWDYPIGFHFTDYVLGHAAVKVTIADGSVFYLDDGWWNGVFEPSDVPWFVWEYEPRPPLQASGPVVNQFIPSPYDPTRLW